MLIKPGVAMLELKRPDTGLFINPTLLWDHEGAYLIDTASPGMAHIITGAMEALGASPSLLEAVIFTHQDLDHTGSIRDLSAVAGKKITAMAHGEERPYIEGERYPLRLVKMEEDLYGLDERMRGFYEFLKANYRRYAVKVDRVLEDREEIPRFGGLVIIHTPGHMPGHVSIYLKEHKVLAAGDALNVIDGRLSGPNPVFTIDMARALKSLEKLLDYDIGAVICHHGGYYEGDIAGRISELARVNL